MSILNSIPIEIQKVLQLAGASCSELKCPAPIYAYVSKPTENNGSKVTYVLLSRYQSHGSVRLGEINPKTRVFTPYSFCMGDSDFYKKARNGIIQEVRISPDKLHQLKNLEEVLAIEGISIKRELVPSNK